MPRKREFDKIILKLLEEYQGILLPYNVLMMELRNRGYHTTDPTLSENLRYLCDKNKVWHLHAYGIPACSAEGLWFAFTFGGLDRTALVINPTEIFGDIYRLFDMPEKLWICDWKKDVEAMLTTRDKIIKEGLSAEIKEELQLWIESVQEDLLQTFPYLGIVDVVTEKGAMTLAQCAEVMTVPFETLEKELKDFRDSKKFEGNIKVKESKKVGKKLEPTG